MPDTTKNISAKAPWLRRSLPWLALYSVCWWLLSGAQGWVFGMVFVALATALTLALGMTVPRLSLAALPPLLVFLFRELWLGGWDVARRAFHPRMPLGQGWVTYALRTQDSRVRLLLSVMIGLMPGTLVARIDGDQLVMHILDQRASWSAAVTRLESLLSQLLREES